MPLPFAHVSRALAISLLLPALVLAQSQAGTVTPLPKPTGPSAVGTMISYLKDGARSDAEYPSGRPITLQLWYPAAGHPGSAPAPYVVEPGLLAHLVEESYYQVDTASFDAWAHLNSYSYLGAAPAPGPHPLIAFSVGLGVIRANYTTLATELASHGYIVAMVENPLVGIMVLPDGHRIEDTAGTLNDVGVLRAAAAAWSGDDSFVLDRLAARDDPASAAVAATIDWHRVGAMGHSIGGLVAMATCSRDRRVRACIDLDGGLATPTGEPLADSVLTGAVAPTLILKEQPIYTDADFARRGITRAEWLKRAGSGGDFAFDTLLAHSRAAVRVIKVAGTGHMTFSDAPFVMPTTISRFGGKIIEARRGWLAITTVIRSFFDAYLGEKPGVFPGGLVKEFPELTVVR